MAEDEQSDLAVSDREVCALLAEVIEAHLPEAEAKVWLNRPGERIEHLVEMLFIAGRQSDPRWDGS